MKMRSVMSHAFSMVPSAEIPRSSFDRSCGYKTTFDAGYLVPVFVDEVLPGDTFNMSMTGFARMATPIFPVMDNIFMDSFFFFVPYRLIWENWERFNGAQDNPDDSTDFVIPTMVPETTYTVGTVADYMGIPVGVGGAFGGISALPWRAYALIYNEWFRDENLQDSCPIDLDDGPDSVTTTTGDGFNALPFRRGKRHDYFTSCLPWPQKGDAVSVPLGASANVVGGTIDVRAGSNGQPTFDAGTSFGRTLNVGGGDTVVNTSGSPSAGILEWADPKLEFTGGTVDLSTATAATINQLRQAFQVQRLLERDARGGTRYTEILRAHFGVVSPDARLQRPEYLGGGSTPINIVPVANTTDAGRPQGDLAAFATASLHNHGFTKSFTEHGVIIGIVSVRADLTYQQGLNRMWSRATRFDFYWPALSHIGEQAVLSKEIWVDGSAGDEDVFGYQERYAEYRYKPSMVTGLFRSDAAGSLDSWHLSQDFANRPVLDEAFIVENPPINRVVAVESEPEFIFDAYFNLRCARPMPVFGVPGMIDHF